MPCSASLSSSWSAFDLAAKRREAAELEEKSSAPNFWDDVRKAQEAMQRLAVLRDTIGEWESLQARLKDALELAQLDDESLAEDLEREVEALQQIVDQRVFEALMSGKYDRENAIVSIHAGAGGTESQDWAQMLLRMYLRWAEAHNMQVEIIDQMEGEGAGIKSVTMTVKGPYAYGYLQSERGVHRLVRISPFDANKRRHTSFALVEVVPDVQGEITDIVIEEKDLEIDTYRSSGAGGQHVQKNETAVRIVHKPTGIVVTCQNERSQNQNRERAMQVLRARLLDLERRKQEEEFAKLKGEHVDVNFGSQIRSYVLHPYQLVKDHRTDHEVGNAAAVLDGRLDDFMEAYLRAKVGQQQA
ncbi:MAG: peptide chain release factor 2 [Candidatus Thermofonsia Clade 1 bacterium]|jgi:peptide chain release factor 2|uniref:Peptide chain release factor 2 n=1 Tax=Candidatus Thermofonsia Clade 1 bacterium TaxID=2364210 RepID=A0A2M8PFV0_9CHLR|nr:MAG: peptide chain release factor 2 [Candidatus Thermofonsia Clade 1 bacterium]